MDALQQKVLSDFVISEDALFNLNLAFVLFRSDIAMFWFIHRCVLKNA